MDSWAFPNGAGYVDWARQRIGNTRWGKLALVALDVEVALGTDPIVRLLSAVTAVEQGRQTPAISTSYSTWRQYVNNTSQFNHLLLWNALWDAESDIDFSRLPFGGWMVDKLFGEQYSGGTDYDGQKVDLDIFDLSKLPHKALGLDSLVPAEFNSPNYTTQARPGLIWREVLEKDGWAFWIWAPPEIRIAAALEGKGCKG